MTNTVKVPVWYSEYRAGRIAWDKLNQSRKDEVIEIEHELGEITDEEYQELKDANEELGK